MIPTIPVAFRIGVLTGYLLLTIAPSYATDEIRTERVQFQRGASSAVVEGRIKGYETVDYLVRAREGQKMNVRLLTKHGATYFNILAPGEDVVAMFNGSVNQNHFEGALPSSGDYKIRVYMMRSAARRDELAPYRLEMSIEGKGASATLASNQDAKVPGTGFDATGNIPCSMGDGRPTGPCAFGVKREGAGSATVTVTRSDGTPRVIFFEQGRAIGYDTSQADTGEFDAKKEADLNIVRIGDERYEIPDAIVQGG